MDDRWTKLKHTPLLNERSQRALVISFKHVDVERKRFREHVHFAWARRTHGRVCNRVRNGQTRRVVHRTKHGVRIAEMLRGLMAEVDEKVGTAEAACPTDVAALHQLRARLRERVGRNQRA